MLGCGNSTLSEDVSREVVSAESFKPMFFLHKMYEDGYKNIVNADVSGLMSGMKTQALNDLHSILGY